MSEIDQRREDENRQPKFTCLISIPDHGWLGIYENESLININRKLVERKCEITTCD